MKDKTERMLRFIFCRKGRGKMMMPGKPEIIKTRAEKI